MDVDTLSKTKTISSNVHKLLQQIGHC